MRVPKRAVPLLGRPINETTIFRVLLAGFMLVTLLLVAAGAVSVLYIRSIKQNVGELVEEEQVTAGLIDDIQRGQAALSAVFYKLSRDPEYVDREKILSELDASDKRLAEIGEWVTDAPEEPQWKELHKAAVAFSAEARRLLSLENPTTLLSRDLFRRHEELLARASKLAAASRQNAATARQQIDARSGELLSHSAILLGALLLLALVCAVLTVRLTVGLLRRMESQSSELGRVSWHLLENQETAARRFSHELHDELGQSLTAAKANLLSLQSASAGDGRRLDDCVRLLDEAIQNARELSHLLHPTVLDDFGLDAALRWLAEGFTTRTGIEVDYQSEFTGRLPDETETHLFRICQEALTNVARHSGASRVAIGLHPEGDHIKLRIQDNGRGLAAAVQPERLGLGLVGMRARARSAGGELTIHSNGEGVRVEASLPTRGVRHEENPHPAG
jgi:signal transduction histidine kinase